MINTDKPIKHKNEDKLNRAIFAESLAKTLMKYNQIDSFTIGLNGEWGSGKTSVINMVIEEIELCKQSQLNKDIVVMEFKPWNISNQDQLIKQFFNMIDSKLNKDFDGKRVKRLVESIEVYSSLFALSSVIHAIGILGTVVGGIGKLFSNTFKNHSKAFNSDNNDLKLKVEKALEEANIKFIIFIDDIDRLSHEEIQLVFQLVKSIAAFPNTIYVLSFDRKIVINALDVMQNNRGEAFLEKIIQVPYVLPSISKDELRTIFFNKIDSILNIDEDDFDKLHWSKTYYKGIDPLIENLRDVNRIINAFSLKYTLVKDDVNFVDLLGITVLQIYAKEVFDLLPNQVEVFTSSYFSRDSFRTKEIEKSIESILKYIPIERYEIIEALLVELFPVINRVTNRFGGQYSANKSNVVLKRISDKLYFDNYFKLSLITPTVSSSEVKRFLFEAEAEDMVQILQNANVAGFTNVFLDLCQSYIKKYEGKDEKLDRIQLVARTILYEWDRLDDCPVTNGLFSYPFTYRKLNIIEALISISSSQSQRFNLIQTIITDEEIQLKYRTEQILSFAKKHGKYNGNKAEQTLLNEEDVDALIDHLLKEIKRKIVNNPLDLSLLENSFFIYQTEHELYTDYIKGLLESEKGKLALIINIVGQGKMAGDFVKDIYNFHFESLEEFMDIESAKQFAQKAIDDRLLFDFGQEEQMKAIAFLMHFELGEYEDTVFKEDVEKRLQSLL